MSEVNFLTEQTGQEILSNLRLGNAYMRTYLQRWDINSWATAFEIGRSGAADRVFSQGDQLIGKYILNGVEYENPWDILGFRDNVVAMVNGSRKTFHKVPVIGMHYTNHVNVAFDPSEPTEADEATAVEGFYYYGYDGSAYTALNLEAGAAVPYGDYTNVFKTIYNSVNAIRYGSSEWQYAFLRQYLNNEGTGWAAKMHPCDVLPNGADTMLGFMSHLEPEMIQQMHACQVFTKQATYAGGELIETFDKFFPLSVSEMNMYNINESADNGEPLEYYKALLESETKKAVGTYPELIKRAVNATTTAQYCRLRGPVVGNYYVWYVYSSGYVYGTNPYNAYRVAPACYLC